MDNKALKSTKILKLTANRSELMDNKALKWTKFHEFVLTE